MSGLLDLSVSKSGEILFDYHAKPVGVLVECGISWHSGAGIIGNVQISDTPICLTTREAWMLSWAAIGIFCRNLAGSLDRATELESCSWPFGRSPPGLHLHIGTAQGASMGSEFFLWLLIPGVDGDEGLSLHVIDYEVVDFTFVVGCVADKEGSVMELEEAFEFFDELPGDLGVGLVVGQRLTEDRDAFFGYDDMCTVAPEEEIIVLLPVNFLVGIIT